MAEVLGLSMNNIFVVAADTTLTPIDLGAILADMFYGRKCH